MGHWPRIRTNEFWVIHLKCDLEANISNQLYFAYLFFVIVK